VRDSFLEEARHCHLIFLIGAGVTAALGHLCGSRSLPLGSLAAVPPSNHREAAAWLGRNIAWASTSPEI